MAAPGSCALCGLEIGVRPYSLTTRLGELSFCCEGCVGIYQMLHEDELLDSNQNKPETTDKKGE